MSVTQVGFLYLRWQLYSHHNVRKKAVTKHRAVSTAPTGHVGVTQAASGDTDMAFLQKSLMQAEGR